jgi:hypothetical protein
MGNVNVVVANQPKLLSANIDLSIAPLALSNDEDATTPAFFILCAVSSPTFLAVSPARLADFSAPVYAEDIIFN